MKSLGQGFLRLWSGVRPSATAQAMASAARPRYEACVLGDSAKRVQGGCALCAGTLLYLGEKGLEVDVTRYTTAPLEDPWVASVCPAEVMPKLPMLRVEGGHWLCGSVPILDWAEAAHPNAPDLGRPAAQLSQGEVELGPLLPLPFGDNIFGPLRTLVTAGAGGGGELEAAGELLLGTLRALDDWLGEHEVGYVGGDDPDATDCFLAPRLMHAALALPDLRGQDLLGQYPMLARYLERWQARRSWRVSAFDPGQALDFWRGKARAAAAQREGG